MKEEEIKTIRGVKMALALIRDRDDVNDEVTELIDNVRYSDFLYEDEYEEL